MPLPQRDRGKSAVASAATVNHCGMNGSPSPLKIESVLPTLLGHHQRGQHRRTGVAKSMYRSYSTLSSAYFKKSTTTSAAAATNSSAASPGCESPDQLLQNAANGSANGFWRVQRTAKEKEKLPDRINLDRRGLTALPVIEDEPALRLLSLQHNLINSFSVPEFVAQANAVAVTNVIAPSPTATPITPTATAEPPPTRNKRPVPIVRHMSTRNLFGNSQLQRNGSPVATTPPPNSVIPPKSAALLHVKDRIYRMKKSSSFISNTNSLAVSVGPHQQRIAAKLQQLRGQPPQANTAAASTDSGISDAESIKHSPPSANRSPPPPPSSAVATTTITPLCDALIVRNEAAAFGQRQQHLESLVFIDLYDNQIERISNLDGLQSLTVLLLGKNRIRDIAGLVSVRKTLRVLDLHGNRIASLGQKICQLQELKSLNLAGNCLRQVHADDFRGLINLRELNLKRNRIKRLAGFEDLRSLERLWLCHNDVQRVEDMAAVATAIQLREVTIENNPVSLGGDCVSFLVSYLPALQLLSQMPVTEQVRRAAQAWRRNKETTDANYSDLSSDVCQSMRREEIISNARTNWELLRGQQQPPPQQQHQSKRGSRHSTAAGDAETTASSPTDGQSDMSECSSSKTTAGSAGRRAFSVVRQKAISSRLRELKKASVHGRVRRRSVSQDNYVVVPVVPVATTPPPPLLAKGGGEVLVAMSDQQLFRLPPILAPFLNLGGGGATASETAAAQQSNNSECSVGPNVDSSSASYVSSDNEAADLKDGDDEDRHEATNETSAEPKRITTPSSPVDQNPPLQIPSTPTEPAPSSPAPKTDQPTLTAPTIVTPPLEESTSSNTSTISNTSNTSSSTAKTATSNIAPPSAATNPNNNSAKCRSAIGMRRIHLPLARAQTAKSINIHHSTPSSCVPFHPGGTTSGSAAAARLSPKPPYSSTASTAGITSSSSASSAACATTTGGGVERAEREREQGGDYLIEICGRYLNVYGAGAVKFIDRQWNAAKAADVHTLKFSYVHFNSVAPVLGRIKQRFPNAENFVFSETSITALGQLNALADVQGIQSLVVERAGNAVCDKNWRPYAIYRLSHWGIRQINGEEVRDAEVAAAQRQYEGLGDLVLWSLPEQVLDPLLVRLRLEESCTASRMTAKQWLMQADGALRGVVGKEALQSVMMTTGGGGSSKGGSGSRNNNNGADGGGADALAQMPQRGKRHLRTMMVNTCDAVEKLQQLETLWPTMLMEIIRNTLLDYAQLDVYVRNHMAELLGGSGAVGAAKPS